MQRDATMKILASLNAKYEIHKFERCLKVVKCLGCSGILGNSKQQKDAFAESIRPRNRLG